MHMRLPDIDTAGTEVARIARFSAVGVVNTLIDIGIFSLLFYGVSAPLLLANTIGYFVAVTNSFILNKYWTFSDTRAQGDPASQLVVFFLLGLGGLVISSLVVWSLSQIMSEIAAKLLSVIVLLVWNFTTSRFIIFRPRHNQPPAIVDS